MDINVETIEGVSIVVLNEEVLDSSNHEEFMDSVTSVLEKSSRVLLDIGNVEMVDSSGLGSFAYCLRKVRDTDGKLLICCPNDTVRDAFSLVHMERIIGVYDTREEAIAAFSA